MKRAFLLTIIFASAFFSARAQNSQILQRTINATGTAWKEVTPDEIYVQVSLQEYNKKNNEKVDIETIKNQFLKNALGIGLTEKEITVQRYSGWNGNIFIYKKNKKNNPDLKAGITYQVKLASTHQMNQLVGILDDDATQNFSISKYDYSKMEDLKKELQVAAVKNAKEKATYTANAIGETVGKAITIDGAMEVTDNAPRLYMAMAKVRSNESADNESSSPMDVDFKKIKVQYNIQVTFLLQ